LAEPIGIFSRSREKVARLHGGLHLHRTPFTDDIQLFLPAPRDETKLPLNETVFGFSRKRCEKGGL
jgi:hypothetical protein